MFTLGDDGEPVCLAILDWHQEHVYGNSEGEIPDSRYDTAWFPTAVEVKGGRL